jgi:apolipoprotein N-acyltransferase
MPPWGWWPLAFVGLAAFSAIEYRARTTAERFSAGLLFGCGWYLPSMSWMWFLTAPGYVIAALLFASLHGVASVLSGHSRLDSSHVVAAPALHTLAETLRLSFPFGGVPLATLGISQVAAPFRSVAGLGGVIALTWTTWQIGALLARRSHRFAGENAWRRAAWLGSAAVILIAPIAPSSSNSGRTLRVVAVQGGGPQGTRAINTDPREVVERHLEASRLIQVPVASGPADPIDLVVWPENVIDVVDFEASREFAEVASEAQRIGAAISVGITEDVDAENFTNAQVIVTPDGHVSARYDKVRRVPFGEYMPLRGFLAAIGAPVDLVPRDALAGAGPAFLDIPTTRGVERAAVAISWEIFFAGRVREGVERDAGFVINPTNGSSYTWTVLQSQQIASSRLRALETGRWVVQVSPTGFSAFVSPSGEVFDRTGVSEQAVLDRVISMRTGHTIYVTVGDGPWIAAVSIVVAMCVILDIRRRRSPYMGRR